MNVLVIGGTGFIGQRLVRSLHAKGQKLFVLVRPQSLEAAKERFKDLSDLHFVLGDIEQTDVVQSIEAQELDGITSVVHLAANYKLAVSFNDAYITNVIGTQNVLQLLKKLKSVEHFHYFSTYAVNHITKGAVSEDFLANNGSNFFDNYARSKNSAEHLIRGRVPAHIKTVIHRPGVICGDSRDGSFDKEDGPYYFFNFVRSLKKLPQVANNLPYLPLPVQQRSLFPLLPVDVLVEWSTRIILSPPSDRLSCYHLIPSREVLTKDFLEATMELMGVKAKVGCVPVPQIFPKIFEALKLPKELVFYMAQEAQFERSNLDKDYPGLVEPAVNEYLPRLIDTYLRKV